MIRSEKTPTIRQRIAEMHYRYIRSTVLGDIETEKHNLDSYNLELDIYIISAVLY